MRRSWTRGAVSAAALVAIAGAGSAAAETTAVADEDPCAILEMAATPSPQALTACRLAREQAWGPDDPRLAPLYDQLARRLSGSQKDAAVALPYRRRAYELTGRLYGDSDPRTGRAALDYARTWILSGRCQPTDPRVAPLIEAARRGFTALPESDPERPDALRQLAAAYSDALRYAEAAEVLEALGPALTEADQERIGEWRDQAGDVAGAEQVFLALMTDDAVDGGRRVRAQQALKRIYFRTGDLDKLEALDAD